MKERHHTKMIWLPAKIAFFSLLVLVCCFACGEKPGNPEKFTLLPFDQLTNNNAPKGIVIKDGKIRLADGFGLDYSADSSMALIMVPGKKGGNTAMRCDCDGLIKIGCIPVMDQIFTCKPLLCSSCKPVLLLYDGFISIDRFREAAKNPK